MDVATARLLREATLSAPPRLATQALLVEMTIDELRRARNVSQEDIAGILEIKQAAVSKQVRRPDWHVSTLRRYIEAMGGQLEAPTR